MASSNDDSDLNFEIENKVTVAPVKHVDTDKFLEVIGEFGRFQIVVEVLLCVATIPSTLPILSSYFVVHNPPWRCTANSSVCKYAQPIDTQDKLFQKRCNMSRTDWEFTESKQFSIVTEFDLYCQTDVYIHISTSLYFVGWSIGAIILGWLADSYGRKLTIFLSFFGLLLFGLASAFSPNIWTFATLRFMVGFFQPGTLPQMTILVSEFVGVKKRPLVTCILFVFFTIGLLMLGMKAFFIQKWRLLIIVCTAPYFFVLLFAFYIPESVRWLHSQGKSVQALNILRRIAKTNRRKFPEFILKPVSPSHKKNESKCHALVFCTSKTLFLSTLIQGWAWLSVGLLYFGLSLAADNLGGGLYQDYVLASLVEFPAGVLSVVGSNRLGRKYTVVLGISIGGISCLLVTAFPTGISEAYTWLRVTSGMLGKFFVTIGYDAIYTWSFELFPTIIRGEGMGIMQVTSRIGCGSAPWIAQWLQVIHHSLPFYIMGGATLFAALTLLFLPETKGQKTAETLPSSVNINDTVYESDEEKPLLVEAAAVNVA